MAEYHHIPIYAIDAQDIPDWMKASQAVSLETLQKYQLEVKMCCAKCEEIVVEKIFEVHGVFNVRAEHFNSKVVVLSMPPPNKLNELEVLRRARKVDKKAKFVELDANERPKTEEQKRKEGEEMRKKEEEEMRKKKEADVMRKKEEDAMRKEKEEDAMRKEEDAMRKKKEEDAMRKKEEEDAMRKKKEDEATAGLMWTPHWNGPNYAPQSYPMRPSQWYEAGSFPEAEEAKKKEAEEKKRKEEEEMRKKEEEEEMRKKKEQEAMAGFMWRPHWNGTHYAPQSYPMRPSQ